MVEEPLTAAILKDALARFEGRLEKRFDRIDHRLDEVQVHFLAVARRFEAVESALGRLARRLDEVDGHVDGLYHALENLRTEYHMLVAGLLHVEERLDRAEEQLALRSEISALKERVDTLQERIRTLEERLTP